MNTNNLITFPLVVMFIFAIVGAPELLAGEGYEEITMEMTRPVSSDQLNGMTAFMMEITDHYLPPVSEGDRDVIRWMIKAELDYWFESKSGHYYTADNLVYAAENEYPDYLTSAQVLAIIRIDPEWLEEMQVLYGRGLGLDKVIIFVGLITGLIALAAIVGLRVFGSGIAGVSVKIIISFTAFFLLWGILTAFSYSYLLGEYTIPIFGPFIWVSLTFSYTLGLMMSLQGGGEDEE